MPIPLCIVYGCFHTAMVELRDGKSCKLPILTMCLFTEWLTDPPLFSHFRIAYALPFGCYICLRVSHSEDITWGVLVVHCLLQCHCFRWGNLVSSFWAISCWKHFSNVKFLIHSFRLMSETIRAERRSPVRGQGLDLDFVVARWDSELVFSRRHL